MLAYICLIEGKRSLMKTMKSVLLVFDDAKELEFIEANLAENRFKIYKAESLKNAVTIAEKCIPDLIVVNAFNNEYDLQLFSKKIKTDRLKNTSILSLIELEDYLKIKTSGKEHLVIKPVRPKLLLSLIRGVMNNEEITWLPAFQA